MTIQDSYPRSELIDAVVQQGKALMTDEFCRFARDLDESQSRDRGFEDLIHAALVRLLRSDAAVASGLDGLVEHATTRPDLIESARHRVPDLHAERGQQVMAGGSLARTSVTLGPPYRFYWTDTRNVQAIVGAQADPRLGNLYAGGTIASIAPGDGSRSFHSAAAVGATFMRRVDGYAEGKGPEGLAWISPGVYDAVHGWTNRPEFASTSLAGGMGIQVRSWDMDGGNQFEDLRTFRRSWSNQAVMFGEFENDSYRFDPFYVDSLFGYESPAFRIRADRLYLVFVYCHVWAHARNMWVRSALVNNFFRGRVQSITVNQT